MVLDTALEGRIAEIVRPMAERWPSLDLDALHAGTRKQAMVPVRADPRAGRHGTWTPRAAAGGPPRADRPRPARPTARATADVVNRGPD